MVVPCLREPSDLADDSCARVILQRGAHISAVVERTKSRSWGAVERGGNVKAKVAKDLKARTLSSFIRGKVQIEGTTIMTDEFNGYCRLKYFVNHETINHQKAYVCRNIHTNSIESF